jgi:hypothetical protein
MQKYRFINNSNQLNMFREMISPILRSIRLASRLRAGTAMRLHYTTNRKHMLSWLELLIKRYCCIYLVVYIIIIIIIIITIIAK